MIERRSTMKRRTGSVKYSSLKRAALLFFVLVMAILPVLTAYASSDSNIGKAKAKQIALKDAGFKESEVKKLFDDETKIQTASLTKSSDLGLEYTTVLNIVKKKSKIRDLYTIS